jgi:MraZ protein
MWGRSEHSLDEKGRVIIPVRFRDKLGEEFVLTTGPGNHIRVYPMPIWEAIEEQLASKNIFDEVNSDVLRLQRVFGNCEFASLDRDNRLTIPRHLRTWANFGQVDNETVIILGRGTCLELWSNTGWANYSKELTEDMANASGSRLQQESQPTSPETNGTMQEPKTPAPDGSKTAEP